MKNLVCFKTFEKLKNQKYKLIVSSIVLSGALVLGGCATEVEKVEDSNMLSPEIEKEIENLANETITVGTEEDVKKYFDDMKKLAIKTIESDSVQNVKDELIDIFILGTDFIFFGTEIKGYTFEELGVETKQHIINTFVEMDEIIREKYPNYKEVVSEEYNMSKEWFGEKLTLLTLITEKELGEENWNNLLETKLQLEQLGVSIVDTSSALYEDGKQKVNEWYNGFKRKHE